MSNHTFEAFEVLTPVLHAINDPDDDLGPVTGRFGGNDRDPCTIALRSFSL